jgi:putative ABC transport system substrate-binding protein
MSYGADVVDLVRRGVGYVDRILKGEQPGDIPIYRASRYELIYKSQNREALGLDVPPQCSQLAVIE